jgi:amino acid adenylation domain-containing protein
VFGREQLTYGDLDVQANQIAQTLRARGIGCGARVGVCLERGIPMLPAVLGILKSGACYVPLDPAFPAERLRFMAENAELDGLISTSVLAPAFNVARSRQLLLDDDAGHITAAATERIGADALSASAEDPAYILYTSGSTGQPKGVVVPHRAVVNFLTSMAREPGVTETDTLVAVTTLSFDIAVLELYLPLVTGGKVVIASRDDTVDGGVLRTLIEDHNATIMQATPVTWRILLEAGWAPTGQFKALVGGEPLPKGLADALLERGAEVWNMYGPTETTVWSTCARIETTADGISIGRPIANTTVHILDENGELAPIGVAGELCIGGRGVALGYWKLPQLTAERFITGNFATDGATRLYRTGDRARWRSDGTLEHLGRMDDQVKVRGFRIELGEIESVLSEHPDIRQAAVRLYQAGPDDVRILAYFVPAKVGLVATSALRKHMRSRLPDYMIPQSFLPIESIPLTPNGKVDRKRLPIPAAQVEHRSPVAETVSDPVEIMIADIWSTLIKPSRPLRPTDRFFEMGGHSLLALQALRQMESRTGTKLDLRTLFQESLGEIAIRCRETSAPPAAAVPIPAKKTATPLEALFQFLRAEPGKERHR